MKKGQPVKLDFADFEIIDAGQTLRFGEYEAAGSAVLYAFDADARKRMKEREREREKAVRHVRARRSQVPAPPRGVP